MRVRTIFFFHPRVSLAVGFMLVVVVLTVPLLVLSTQHPQIASSFRLSIERSCSIVGNEEGSTRRREVCHGNGI
jgi:hypothetical protein